MLNALNIIGGILAMVIGFVMVFIAVPRNGVSLKFLETESMSILYVLTSLGLIVVGIAWAFSYSATVFAS